MVLGVPAGGRRKRISPHDTNKMGTQLVQTTSGQNPTQTKSGVSVNQVVQRCVCMWVWGEVGGPQGLGVFICNECMLYEAFRK